MATNERLKVNRALSTHTRKHLRLVSKSADDAREHRDTDRAPEGPEHRTLPPDAITNTANHRPEMPPPAAAEPRPDPHSYSDFVLSELLANSRQLKADSAAFAANRNELSILFGEQTAAIERSITANYGLVKAEVVALRTEHESFRDELESLKKQIEQKTTALEQLRAKVDELEIKLASREGPHVSAETATPGEQPVSARIPG